MADAQGLLESALEALAEPWVVWGAEGRAVAASRRLIDTIGVPFEEVVGTSERGFVEALARHGASPVSGAPVPTVRTATGHDFERKGRALPAGGRLETFHDLTVRQAELARREELLGVAIHDLRAPLANVRSYAGLLLSGKMPEVEPRVRRSAEVIARNADRALRLLQTYFDAHRAETGELEIDRQPVPLANLLQELLAARRASAAEKSVELAATFPATLPTVVGDHDRLLNALGAMLDNAIVRSPPNARVEVVYDDRPREAWIGFVDGGPTLSASEVREAFDRDAQALRERRLGAGFAVAVARSIARTHGGDAGVSSAPGRTIFSMSLPR